MYVLMHASFERNLSTRETTTADLPVRKHETKQNKGKVHDGFKVLPCDRLIR